MLTDTHAHLDFPKIQEDLAGVLQRANAAGVKRIITIGTTVAGSLRSRQLAEEYSHIYCAVGVHPNNVSEEPAGYVEALRTLADSPRVVALGEMGLDYHYLPSTRGGSGEDDENEKAAQAAAFRAQLALAAELALPVIIHERDSWDDTLSILAEFTGRVRAVFHCFGKSPEHLRQLVALGHTASFTGIVTFKTAPEAQASAREVAAGTFFVETDSPYLSPIPHRGKPCEPAFVRHTAEFIAGLRGVSLEQLAAETESAVNHFFRFPK